MMSKLTMPVRIKRGRKLLSDISGIAAIEFGYMLPIFVGFGLVGLEFTNVVLAKQKTERVAATVADQIAGNQVPPNERQIGDMFAGVTKIAQPFGYIAQGNVIITAVVGINDSTDNEVQNKIAWQRCMRPNSQVSQIGQQWTRTNDIADGPEVTLANDLELAQNQMVIVAEVFYPYESMMSRTIIEDYLPASTIFRETATFRTRGQAIMNVTPVAGVNEFRCTA